MPLLPSPRRGPVPDGPRRVAAVLLAAGLVAPLPVAAQATGVLRGTVTDTQLAPVAGASVHLAQPVSGLERRATTGADGRYEIASLPLAEYALVVVGAGFAAAQILVRLTSSVPVHHDVVLEIEGQHETVTVTPASPLVDARGTGSIHAVSLARFERLPAATSNRGLEAVLLAFPGFAQNANGAIHPRGAHNQMTFVVDGLPISDQLTGAFANSLDAGIVEAAELMTGNIAAEFGSKVSGIVVVTSRSGLAAGRPLAGSVTVSAGGFGTTNTAVHAGGVRGRLGYFTSATAFGTDRFLDQVSLDNLHNSGDSVRAFARLDLVPTPRDMVRVNAMGGRARFELANLRSQDAAGQDQRQRLSDVAAWASYTRSLGARATVEALVGQRRTNARLIPSAGDTPVTAAQDRALETLTVSTRLAHATGTVTWRGGVDVQRFPVREHFTMGITSPAFNAPDASGFNDNLVPYDLTRGGVPFVFEDRQTGTLASGFLQTSAQRGPLTAVLGVRFDAYNFLVEGRQVQPRTGLAFRIPGRDLVLRASYNRNYQTPPNENLLLSSSEAAARLAPDVVIEALGGSSRPIQPQREDVVEIGAQLGLGRLGLLDVAAYRKRSVNQQDNNNFFDTGIIFPTSLAAIAVGGIEARLTMPTRRGLTGSISATSGRAISTPPFTGGLFLGQDAIDLLSAGPFAIDHDQRLSVHGTISYDPQGPLWVSGAVRYDSGLVANPSNPAEVAADPDFADLLPFVDLDADVPRVRPRTMLDLAAGIDLTRADGRRTWTASLQVTNLTNQTALFNFQSVFVGTRLVQPRTAAVRVTRHF